MPFSACVAQLYPDYPLVVAYALGVDSTAMLIEFAFRGIRPDLILFADTGAEKPETYAYLPVIQQYLAGVAFPPVITVRYVPTRAAYHTLEDQCLHTGTLPSLA
jgi:3'-phosphoadenosine 5'-phosphosulfate sulfotransferase (PAPS reductase)/FAD synthetase